MRDECSYDGCVVAPSPEPGKVLTEEFHVGPEAVGHDAGREHLELSVTTYAGHVHWCVASCSTERIVLYSTYDLWNP